MTRGGDCPINEDAWGHPYQKIVTEQRFTGSSEQPQESRFSVLRTNQL